MAQTMTADAAATKGKSLPARVAGVIFSPRATYADVAARPRVLGICGKNILRDCSGLHVDTEVAPAMTRTN